MIELSRRVRFCVNPCLQGKHGKVLTAADQPHNSFAGWPTMHGIGAFYELQVTCRGPIDESTGYMMNISRIDAVVRQHAISIIERAVCERPQQEPGGVLRDVLDAISPALDNRVSHVTWWLTPFYNVTMERENMNSVVIGQQFDFAAAHRLHRPDLSEEENKRIFGRCNHPGYHGHNYRLEVAVRISVVDLNAAADAGGSPSVMTLSDVERVVDETVVQRFDHTNLNLDHVEFSDLNPSVENIARVIFDLLSPAVARSGGELESVTVWETEKTWCRYPAPAHARTADCAAAGAAKQ